MGQRRDDVKAESMYQEYLAGNSLSEVAKKFNITRQSVYNTFTRRNYKLRNKELHPKKVFNEITYTQRTEGGYFRRTTGKRNLMHRDIWEFYNGPIPEGWDIHHKDYDKGNNDISNLECLPKAEHTRLYSPHNNQYTKGRKRAS